jgi:AraC-like DNA-binding protein
MIPPHPLSNARSELHLPRFSLNGCIRGVMLRDTRGVTLGPEQRFNHYPATPLCSISWYLKGEIDMLDPGCPPTLNALRQAIVAPIVFSGPQTHPVITWSRGQGYGMMLLLLPDAFNALTGLDPGRWLNRTVDASDVLPESWLVMCERVRVASIDLERVHLMEEFLDPLWQTYRPKQALDMQRYADWLQGIALRAATSKVGRSLRQIERRILQWTGQPMRELRGFVRAERAFFDSMAKVDTIPMDWVGLALDNDFSDQSHLCRISRRMTGFSPTALRERIANDEGFWPYRIWQ